jgi:hypothetical protein
VAADFLCVFPLYLMLVFLKFPYRVNCRKPVTLFFLKTVVRSFAVDDLNVFRCESIVMQ